MTDDQRDPTIPGPALTDEREPGSPWVGRAAAAAVIILVIVAAAALLVAGQRTPEPVEEAAISDIADASEPMDGQRVTVSGQVDELLTERALTIDDAETDEPLLVLVRPTAIINGVVPTGGVVDPVSQIVPSDSPVQVFGTVESFDRESMAEELGMVLNEDLFGSWEGSRVLLAEQLDTFLDSSPPPSNEASDPPEEDPADVG